MKKNLTWTEMKTIGNEKFRLGDFQTAQRHYNDALKQCKFHEKHVLFSNIAAAQYKQGKYKESLVSASKCVYLNSEFEKGYVRVILAEIALQECGLTVDMGFDGIKSIEMWKGLKENLLQLRRKKILRIWKASKIYREKFEKFLTQDFMQKISGFVEEKKFKKVHEILNDYVFSKNGSLFPSQEQHFEFIRNVISLTKYFKSELFLQEAKKLSSFDRILVVDPCGNGDYDSLVKCVWLNRIDRVTIFISSACYISNQLISGGVSQFEIVGLNESCCVVSGGKIHHPQTPDFWGKLVISEGYNQSKIFCDYIFFINTNKFMGYENGIMEFLRDFVKDSDLQIGLKNLNFYGVLLSYPRVMIGIRISLINNLHEKRKSENIIQNPKLFSISVDNCRFYNCYIVLKSQICREQTGTIGKGIKDYVPCHPKGKISNVNITFQNCGVLNGVIDVANVNHVCFSNCEIKNCKYYTAALRLLEVRKFELINSTISDNMCQGMCVVAVSNFLIKNCKFARNNSIHAGSPGSISHFFLLGVKVAKILSSDFLSSYGNSSELIEVYESVVDGCKFSGLDEGLTCGLSILNRKISIISITNCSFKNFKTIALHIRNSKKGKKFKFIGNSFLNNSNSLFGGFDVFVGAGIKIKKELQKTPITIFAQPDVKVDKILKNVMKINKKNKERKKWRESKKVTLKPDLGVVAICDYCRSSESHCENDSGVYKKYKICSGCMKTRFCSRECQKKAWKLYHKEECNALN